MKIDRSGLPFVAAAASSAVLCLWRGWTAGAAGFAALTAFFAFFFRDPERHTPADPRAVVAPADGRIMIAGPADPEGAPPGEWLQIAIFLSPVDVHINRMPVSGTVVRVERKPGGYRPAYRRESRDNAQTEIWVDRDGQTIVFRQVVGVLARRIVCRIGPGDRLRAGDRIGLMKFGSRMDLFLPTSSRLLVERGQQVRGGETRVASLG